MLFERRKKRLLLKALDGGKKYSAFRNFSQFGPDSIGSGAIEVTFKNNSGHSVPVSLFQPFDTTDVSITTTGSGGYQQLISSIISKPFVVKNFKVLATTKTQLRQPFVFTYKNERGEVKQMTVVPSQFGSAYQTIQTEIDTLGTKMIVDSDSSINFTLLPNEEVTIVLQMGKQVDPVKGLNSKNNNFNNFLPQVLGNLMSNQADHDRQYGPGIGNTIYQGTRFIDTLH